MDTSTAAAPARQWPARRTPASRDPIAALESLARAATAPDAASAATQLAAAGTPVFPCLAGAKRPLTRRGFHDASTDPDKVAWWWRRHPTANLAVPTGAASGLDVVDIDVHGAASGFKAFGRAHAAGLTAGWGLLVRTPSGGRHVYYPHPPGGEQRSWALPGTHVDFRGDGGYIVVPPSVVVSDAGLAAYRVTAAFPPGSPAPIDAGGLRAFLDPPRPSHAAHALMAVPTSGADPDRLAAWVASRPAGGRNQGLFWAACRMAEHGYQLRETRAALLPAAAHAGLEERETDSTIRSAYRRTATNRTDSRVTSGPSNEANTL